MGLNVYVTRRIPEPGVRIVREHCSPVEVNPDDRVLSHAELVEKVRARDGVLCLLTDTIDEAVLEAARGARVFANYAVGYDNIDVAAATRWDIMVTNTPGVLTDATSDMAWALLFSVARRVVEGDAYTRAGRFKGWAPTLLLGADITRRTLGVIGAGRIGTAFALKSVGFDMRVLYADPVPNDRLEAIGAERVDLDRLLHESDFVSVHVALSESTRHLIGPDALRKMKDTACLINTSRGPVVDEAALAEALQQGWIAGAGLDVYEDEPLLTPGLSDCPNAVLCPHVASATRHTRGEMARMAAENLVAALRGQRPTNLVNPEVLDRQQQ